MLSSLNARRWIAHQTSTIKKDKVIDSDAASDQDRLQEFPSKYHKNEKLHLTTQISNEFLKLTWMDQSTNG